MPKCMCRQENMRQENTRTLADKSTRAYKGTCAAKRTRVDKGTCAAKRKRSDNVHADKRISEGASIPTCGDVVHSFWKER
jgi:hypothetical protein